MASSQSRRGPGSWLAWLVPVSALVVYRLTMAPTVGLIDSGELSAGCFLLNVLHPTGYPLYTALGRLATLVPLGSVANRVAGMSAVLSAVGVGLFVRFCFGLGLSPWAAVGAGLALAFSVPVWSVSVDAEVYSFTFVMAMLVWLGVAQIKERHRLLLFAYLAGLALTNHMSVASVVVGAGVAVFLNMGRELPRRLPGMVLLFLLGLSPYLFLLLRARAGPVMAWGSPVNPERLWWHMTGRQYQVWMFSMPPGEVLANAGRGAVMLGRSLAWVMIPVTGIGAVRVLRERRALGVGLSVAALLSFLYAANYSIPDIEAYYLPAMLTLAVFSACGMDRLIRRWKPARFAVLVPAAILVATGLPSLGRQGHYVAHDAAMNVLASADSNGIILTDWWDLYAPVFYLQHVEGVRPDLCVIDKELVRRSWYLEFIEKEYPWLVRHAKTELERYRPHLDDFELGRLKSPEAIQLAYVALLRRLVMWDGVRPAYVTFGPDAGTDAKQVLAGLRLAPVGMLLELRSDTVLPEFDYTKLRVRVPGQGMDDRTRANLARYRYFAGRRAQALMDAGRTDEARAVARWVETTLGPATTRRR